jgi:drug/metabolite transporter (DMT)-like permease
MNHLRGVLAASASSLLGGSCVVATRYVIGATDPLTLALLRYGIGVICLLPLAWWLRSIAVAKADRLPIALLGLLFFAVFPVLFNASLAYTTAPRGSLALSTLPLLTLLFASAWRAEKLTGLKLAGVLLAAGGVASALSGQIGSDSQPDAWIGDLLMVATAACGAVYNVLAGPYLRRYPALVVTTWAMLAGVLGLVVVNIGQGVSAPVLAPGEWAVVAFLGIVGAALTFLLWSWGLEYTTPTRVAVTVTLNPVASMVLAALLLGEAVTPRLMLGLVAVMAGIALANWPVRQVRSAA